MLNIGEMLNAIDFFQDEFYGHPLTCGNDSQNHELLRGSVRNGQVILVCPSCDYEQEWIPQYVEDVYVRREQIIAFYETDPFMRLLTGREVREEPEED